MQRALIIGAVVATVAAMGVTGYVGLEERVAYVDQLRQELPGSTRAMWAEIEALRAELEEARSGADLDGQRVAVLAGRLEGLGTSLTHTLARVDEQAHTLGGLEQRQGQLTPELVETRLAEFEDGVRSRWDGLSRAVSAAANLAERTEAELQELGAEFEGISEQARWRAMVGPTVQLAGDTTVGSGVMLQSRLLEDTDEWETLLVTAWHVVRDIRADGFQEDPPIPVAIFMENGEVRRETAELVAYDVRLDVALLELESTEQVPCGATLPTREHLEGVKIFRPVYAVGCPLGNDPIPTRGELADLDHEIDGNRYWMISAPTYIGNSGGGIYDGRTHELLGIFSKIYTHGTLRPTIVPHMGLVTPIGRVYDWLEEADYGHLVPDGEPSAPLAEPR